MAAKQERTFDAYHNTAISPRGGDAALVETFRRGGLTSQQLGVAVNEWHEPSFEAHAEGGFNVWRLFNACTQAVKPTGARVNHNHVAERTRIATEFMDELVTLL